MEKTYEVALVTGNAFTVISDDSMDEIHEILFNEDGLTMFTLYDGKPVLIRGSSVAAVWEV